MTEPKPTPTPTPTTSSGIPKISWSMDSGSNQESPNGISIGFGTNKKLVPAKVGSYVTSLAASNPKAFRNIKLAIQKATGKTYNDPNQVGTWLQKTAENMFYSNDSSVTSLSIEDFIRAATASKISGTSTQANIPTRQVYQSTPEQNAAKVDQAALNLLGRELTDVDKQAVWYKDLTKTIEDMISQGIVTTTSVVKNPKTGKMETLVKQTPGFSQEGIQQTITKALQTADPESLARKERVDFTKWLFSQKGGTE